MKLLPYPAASHPSGTIHFKGQELLGLPEREIREVRGNDITIIFQEPMTSLNPLHTIEKQIGEILLLHGGMTGAPARKRIIELLTQVGIPDPDGRLASYPHQLSGGQRQRVMIAMALANEPDLLIADEPTTALDVTVQAQILKLLKDLQTRLGMAMLFITHDLGIVRKIADRVCVMKEGKIVEPGRSHDVFERPQHPYTRALLAAEPKPDPAPLQPRRADRGRDRQSEGLVSDQARRAAQGGRPHQGGRRRQHRGAQGRDARHRRRIRLGQDHARPRDPAADLVGRPDRVHGQAAAGPEVQGDAAVPPRHADRVPGSLRLALAAHVGRPTSSRKACGCISRSCRPSEREARVIAALRDVGLDPETRFRYPHEFSGGQRQRIAVARAIVLEPTFVVLDEPTSALDMLIQSQIVDLLRDLQKRHNLTYLFISHDLRVVVGAGEPADRDAQRQGGGGRARRRSVRAIRRATTRARCSPPPSISRPRPRAWSNAVIRRSATRLMTKARSLC